jgi:hypothetical protein
MMVLQQGLSVPRQQAGHLCCETANYRMKLTGCGSVEQGNSYSSIPKPSGTGYAASCEPSKQWASLCGNTIDAWRLTWAANQDLAGTSIISLEDSRQPCVVVVSPTLNASRLRYSVERTMRAAGS